MGRPGSNIWDHFARQENRATCKYCKKEFAAVAKRCLNHYRVCENTPFPSSVSQSSFSSSASVEENTIKKRKIESFLTVHPPVSSSLKFQLDEQLCVAFIYVSYDYQHV